MNPPGAYSASELINQGDRTSPVDIPQTLLTNARHMPILLLDIAVADWSPSMPSPVLFRTRCDLAQ